jgi:hypothetical protein
MIVTSIKESALKRMIELFVYRVGSILCDPTAPVKNATKMKARIIVFNIDIPITRGFMVSTPVNIKFTDPWAPRTLCN